MRSTLLRRGLPALLVTLFVAVAGCGGSSGAGAGGDDDDGGPTSVLPAHAPVAAQLEVGPGTDAGKAILAFAEKVDPSARDLGDELIKSLGSGEDAVDYRRDVQPWLGKKVAVAFDSFKNENGGGIVAFESKNENAVRTYLKRSKKDDKATSRSYEGTDFDVAPDGESRGLIDGFVVVATDAAHFKLAVDASKGRSLADDSEYKDAIERAPDGASAIGVLQVGRFLSALADADAIPPDTLAQIRKAPGFNDAGSLTMALLAKSDKMTLELAAKGAKSATKTDGAPKLSDLPGDAWLALAGPIATKQFETGFRQGLGQSNPQATQFAEQFGLLDFVRGVNGISLRLGGSSLFSVNGELTLSGDDQAAATKLVRRLEPQVRQAASGEKVQVRHTASGFDVSVLPYSAKIEARDGDLRISSGDRPSAKLDDQASFQSAVDGLDLDGGTAAFFTDFAPIAKLVASIPGQNDPDLLTTQRVLEHLGTLVVGNSRDGDIGRTRIVLTAR